MRFFGAALVVSSIVAALATAYSGVRAESDRVKIKLGSVYLSVPSKQLQAERPAWLNYIPGLDDGSRSILLDIEAEEVGKNIDGYKILNGRYKEDIRLIVTYLTSVEYERYLENQTAADAWFELNSYRGRIIEKDNSTGNYKIFRKIDYPDSWKVFKDNPESDFAGTSPQESWIANCVRSKSSMTPDGYLSLCKSYVVHRNIAVEFTVSEENLTKIRLLKEYFEKLLNDWLDK